MWVTRRRRTQWLAPMPVSKTQASTADLALASRTVNSWWSPRSIKTQLACHRIANSRPKMLHRQRCRTRVRIDPKIIRVPIWSPPSSRSNPSLVTFSPSISAHKKSRLWSSKLNNTMQASRKMEKVTVTALWIIFTTIHSNKAASRSSSTNRRCMVRLTIARLAAHPTSLQQAKTRGFPCLWAERSSLTSSTLSRLRKVSSGARIRGLQVIKLLKHSIRCLSDLASSLTVSWSYSLVEYVFLTKLSSRNCPLNRSLMWSKKICATSKT